MERWRRVVSVLSVLPLLPLAGCPDSTAGIDLGTYEVIAMRTAGTCGAWREQGTYSFRVRLTLGSGSLRWAEATGRTINGTVDVRARSFQVALEERALVLPANRVSGYVGCTMVRQDVIDGVFEGPLPEPGDAGVSVDGGDGGDGGNASDGGVVASPPFRGTLSTSFAPATGSDCSPAVGASAQQWAALPCTLGYTIRGTR